MSCEQLTNSVHSPSASALIKYTYGKVNTKTGKLLLSRSTDADIAFVVFLPSQMKM